MKIEIELKPKPGYYFKKETLEAFLYEFLEYGEVIMYSLPRDSGYIWEAEYTEEELEYLPDLKGKRWFELFEVHTIVDGVNIR